MDRHLDTNVLVQILYPLKSGSCEHNLCKIIVIDKVQRKIIPKKQLRQKVSHIVVDFSNRDGETSVIYTASI